MPPGVLAERIGEPAWTLLRDHRVLVDLSIPSSYPCGGWEGDGCPREVIHEPTVRHPEHPYLAICGHDGLGCESLRFSAADLARVGTSMGTLARMVATLYGVKDAAPRPIGDFPGVHELGVESGGRALAFSATPQLRSVRLFLRGVRGATSLIIPTRAGVPLDLLERHAPGERVELRVLADEIVIRDGRIVRARPLSPVMTAARVVIDEHGERPLDEAAYSALREELDRLDLFVDLTAPIDADHIAARTREVDGSFRESEITRLQAEALLELARHHRPVRAGRLRTLIDGGIRDKVRHVERMRQAVDVKLGHRRWRFINAIAGDVPEAKTFVFAPVSGAKYSLVLNRTTPL